MASLSAAIASQVVPPGAVKVWASAVDPPAGWLLCRGDVVSQEAYPFLFAAIGTVYNTGGEGAGNFRLPNLQGEFLRGLDHSGSVDPGRSLGAAPQGNQQGRHRHAATGLAINAPSGTAPHTHSITTNSVNAPHAHPMRVSANPGSGARQGQDYVADGPSSATPQGVSTAPSTGPHGHPSTTAPAPSTNVSSHSHPSITGSVGAAGGTSNSSETRPRNVAVNYVIKF